MFVNIIGRCRVVKFVRVARVLISAQLSNALNVIRLIQKQDIKNRGNSVNPTEYTGL